MVEKICKRCNGTGWILRFDSIFKPYKASCPECEGSGYVLEELSPDSSNRLKSVVSSGHEL